MKFRYGRWLKIKSARIPPQSVLSTEELHMNISEDIVIVGAGVAGLATALGLHRLGLRSLVLESADKLRTTGYALTLWTNAWKALDAIGIADSLRQNYLPLRGFHVAPADPARPASEILLETNGKHKNCESRCVKRKELLETLAEALPSGTIRYSSKVVSIEKSGNMKLVHLEDGSTLKTKVLIGCDGVNSVVAKWLDLQEPASTGRLSIRGLVEYPEGHKFEPMFYAYFGSGVRYGIVPCDEKALYWFCTFSPSVADFEQGTEEDPLKLKQFILSRIENVAAEARAVVERTGPFCLSCEPLKLRKPWNILSKDITKSNVCVAGDALHPMTPDSGQGGCSALEDSVVLARCLAQALVIEGKPSFRDSEDDKEFERIKKGLEKYGKARRWRSFNLITTAYALGFIQETDGKMINFLKDKWLSRYSLEMRLKMANFDCGQLVLS